MVNIGRSTIFTVLALCVLAFAYAAPNLFERGSLDDLPGWAPSKQISLGLDLQGGSYLLLEVETEAVVSERLESMLDALRRDLRRERIFYKPGSLNIDGGAAGFTLRDESRREDALLIARRVARDESGEEFGLGFGGPPPVSVVELDSGRIAVEPSDDAIDEWRLNAVAQSIEIVRRRVDGTGTTEPLIQRQGDNRIILAVPGVEDPERLKAVIGTTAKMTFRFVMENADPNARRAPAGGQILPGEGFAPGSTANYVVERRVMVSGDRLVDAQSTFDQNGRPAVAFRFDAAGAKRFADATAENVNRLFAIVLDDFVVSAPRINEPILGGSGQITGNFSVQEANDLAIVLRAGALPAPLTILEERTVGAGLGQDSIEAGEIAAVIGLALVVVFMIAAYGLFGAFAVVALVVNMAAIVALLSFLQATLTLPGIAGMVLTIGMAVDANVLIFERIREEQAAGRTPINAVDAGYKRALSTIVDSNLTTAIAAAMLFAFGSGPVKGFSVTLLIGILTTLFTAIMVTRLMVVAYLRSNRRRASALPI